MICPDCKSVIPDNLKVCSSCGYNLEKNDNNPTDKKNKEIRQHKRSLKIKNIKRIKIVAVALAIIFLLIVICCICIGASSSKGLRKSEKLSKKIGQPIEKAASYADIEFTKSSDFQYLNSVIDYNSVYESDKKTSIYGINMPQWAIFCNEDMFGNLSSVSYYDFRILKDNINGIKKKSKIDLSAVTSGMSKKDVDKILDMEPYQTVVSDGTTSRKYKYYYKDKQSGSIKSYNLTILFSSSTGNVNAPVIEEESSLISYILNDTD